MGKNGSNTRQQIMQAALQRFAEKGYAGTSVQEIVDAARVTKPALYYYFQSKAGLYCALVDWAQEERHRLMKEAAARGRDLTGQLQEICAVLFEFIRGHRELTRLAIVAAFAARGEVPAEVDCGRKAMRNFEFIKGLIQQARARGELNSRFDAHELAMAFLGMMNLHIMAYLVRLQGPPDRRTARRLVGLFLAGAKPV